MGKLGIGLLAAAGGIVVGAVAAGLIVRHYAKGACAEGVGAGVGDAIARATHSTTVGALAGKIVTGLIGSSS